MTTFPKTGQKKAGQKEAATDDEAAWSARARAGSSLKSRTPASSASRVKKVRL